jgi:hypothetical protein
MTAVVSRSRAKSTWLTGAAGLLILAAAFTMMICAAPVTRTPLHATTTQSVTTRCGQQPSGQDPARVRACQVDPSTLSALTKPYGRTTVTGRWPAIKLAPSSHHASIKPSS